MSTDAFVQLIVAMIMILGVIISSYFIPFLSSLSQESELGKLMDFAEKAVEWANQTIPPEEWQRKKREVMALVINYMNDQLRIKLDVDQLDVIVEALVNEAKKLIKG